jgi:Family of unknown function (DUF6653)
MSNNSTESTVSIPALDRIDAFVSQVDRRLTTAPVSEHTTTTTTTPAIAAGQSAPSIEGVTMGASATPSTGKVTTDAKIAKLFGLQGEAWMRHANPVSVWTRFAVLPLLAVSVWSRDWIGWWSLIPIALSLVFMMINPLLFPKPHSTRNWASKGVFGERIWADRNIVELPDQFRSSHVPQVTYLFQMVGTAVLVYGLVELDLLAVVSGLAILQCAKAWFIDRMVLLFEDMKTSNPEYASWEY